MVWPAVIAGAGAVASLAGGLQSGKQQKQLGRLSEALGRQQARSVERAGAEQERRYRLDLERLIGTQRTAFAGQGVTLDSGSALDVQGQTAYIGELDALQIRQNAALQAWGIRSEAPLGRFISEAGAKATKTAAAGGALQMGSLLFGGGGG